MAPASDETWPGGLIPLAWSGDPLHQELGALARAYARQARRRWQALTDNQLQWLMHDRLMLLLGCQFPTLRYRVVLP